MYALMKFEGTIMMILSLGLTNHQTVSVICVKLVDNNLI